MTKCPLISFGKQYCAEVDCMGEECMFWSVNKDNCLIRLALLKYSKDISSAEIEERDPLDARIKILENQIKSLAIGFPIVNYQIDLGTTKYPPNNPVGGDLASTIEKDWSGLQGGL